MRLSTNKPRRILVVALDNLGDSIMGAAVLKPLREIYPKASLGYWVKKYAAGLYEDHPLLNRVHAADPFWDTAPGHAKGAFADFKSALRRIRAERYDAAFILNTEWRRALACRLAGIPLRVGYARRRSRPFLTHAVAPPSRAQHFIADHRQLIEAFSGQSLSDDFFIPHIALNSREEEWGARWFANLGWNNVPVVAVHPFAGDERKCWPPEKWKEMIRLLASERDINFLIFGGASDRASLDKILDESSPRSCAMIGAELGQVKAALKHSHLFVGADSGIGHLAAALQLPVVSLFGATTNPIRCAPRGRSPIEIVRHDPLHALPASEVAQVVERVFDALSNTRD